MTILSQYNFWKVELRTSTQSTLRAQSRSGRISQRGDIAPVEELRCAILRAEGLALRRGWVSRGAQRCDKVGDIVSKWKSCDEGGDCATCAWIRIAQLKVLRVDEDVRCAKIADLGIHKSKKRDVGCAEPGPRHLSLGQPIRFTSGETSDRFAVCRRKGQ